LRMRLLALPVLPELFDAVETLMGWSKKACA